METLEKPKKRPGRPRKLEETRKNLQFSEENPENLAETEFSEDELCRELCRDSFYFFLKEFWSEIVQEEPIWNWHIKELCREFQRIAQRVFDGLPLDADTTVNISPGSTKTLIASIMFPAWVWTRMPHAVIISASYALEGIADDASSKSRDVIQSEKYRRLFPEIKLREDTNAKANFKNTRGGVRYAFGIGGSVTGKHAHFIIVDDPLNPEQAASEAELTRANRWMERTLPSRKVNKKVCPTILIMQRLHENDPTGARIEREKNGYKHNHWCLPAELTDDVKPEWCRQYYVDGLMDPVRCDADVLMQVEREQGEFVLASQYHQTPIPEGTALFHVGKLTVEEPHKVPRLVKEVRAWDKACLVSGTIVNTSCGQRPIEAIRAGDRVLTRNGYREVKWAGKTKEVKQTCRAYLSNGEVLEGTSDHRVWTENRGWVPLASLICGSYSQEDLKGTKWVSGRGKARLNPSCLTEFYSRKTPASIITSLGENTRLQANGGTTLYTEPYTGLRSAPSQRATTYTTKTATRRTTAQATSSPSPAPSTVNTTTPSRIGIKRKRRRNCGQLTTSKSKRCWPKSNPPRELARGVERNSTPSTFNRRESSGAVESSVGGVNKKSDVLRGSNGKEVHVVRVAVSRLKTPVDVFDLTVAEDHEFFANGVLVHNSSEGAGAFTVGFKVGVDEQGHFWVLDVVRDRLDSFRRERLIKTTANNDGRYTLIGVEQEPGSGGKHSAQTTVKNLAGFKVMAEPVGKSDGDKTARAYVFSTQVNAGNVTLVKGDWNQALISEMRFFPFSRFKDQVDAGSLAFRLICNKKRKLGGGSILRRKAR